MPAFTCSLIRALVKKPSANTTSRKLGTPCSGLNSDGSTWYQRKICTSSGMLRKSSVHASPMKTRRLSGTVRKMPMSEPTSNATPIASSATLSVQPQAESIQSR